ncbi:unnamed protein product [Pleuronectes platessa]|uniref:Uncharacterized protein n=1 Tax=Pleuronectes platessa TaxID=8262 RepID=A0A9N7U5W2_PLEPL|nr:unnamed protein product [Pleuronectes platessa]
MLDPSSSEDTGGESDPEVVEEAARKPASSSGKRASSSRAGGQQRESAAPGAAAGKGARDGADAGEDEERKERERIQREEEERKTKLQIYVLVLRCIAYPFNAKQPTDMARRQQKIPGDGALLRALCNLSSSSSSSSSSSWRCERMSQQGSHKAGFSVKSIRPLVSPALGAEDSPHSAKTLTDI